MSRGQIPSVGRVVHYVSHGTPVREDGTQAYTSVCRAAVITEVRLITGAGDAPEASEHWGYIPQAVALAVLNPTGMFFSPDVVQDEDGHQGGTWHWPERVG